MERASRIVNKWGAPVVAFSFLTIGFQTACNAAAGLTGMPLRRYLPALAVGGFAWAIIYATVGLVAGAARARCGTDGPMATPPPAPEPGRGGDTQPGACIAGGNPRRATPGAGR